MKPWHSSLFYFACSAAFLLQASFSSAAISDHIQVSAKVRTLFDPQAENPLDVEYSHIGFRLGARTINNALKEYGVDSLKDPQVDYITNIAFNFSVVPCLLELGGGLALDAPGLEALRQIRSEINAGISAKIGQTLESVPQFHLLPKQIQNQIKNQFLNSANLMLDMELEAIKGSENQKDLKSRPSLAFQEVAVVLSHVLMTGSATIYVTAHKMPPKKGIQVHSSAFVLHEGLQHNPEPKSSQELALNLSNDFSMKYGRWKVDTTLLQDLLRPKRNDIYVVFVNDGQNPDQKPETVLRITPQNAIQQEYFAGNELPFRAGSNVYFARSVSEGIRIFAGSEAMKETLLKPGNSGKGSLVDSREYVGGISVTLYEETFGPRSNPSAKLKWDVTADISVPIGPSPGLQSDLENLGQRGGTQINLTW